MRTHACSNIISGLLRHPCRDLAHTPRERHFHILTCSKRRPPVTDTKEKVGHDETAKPPRLFEYIGQQPMVFTGPNAIDLVVSAHHCIDASVDAVSEMRQVDLVEIALVDLNIDNPSGVLNGVRRKMLDTGHEVPLRAGDHGSSHLTEQMGIFAVGLLSPPPGRVPQHVDTDTGKEVGAGRYRFDADRLTDSFFEFGQECRGAGHRHRKAGRLADHHTPGTVRESNAGKSESVDLASDDRTVVVEPGHGDGAADKRIVAGHDVANIGGAHQIDKFVRDHVGEVAIVELRMCRPADVESFEKCPPHSPYRRLVSHLVTPVVGLHDATSTDGWTLRGPHSEVPVHWPRPEHC